MTLRSRRLLPVLISLLLLLAIGGVFWQRWAIHDWWRLRDYQASETIAQLATDTTMNEDARRLFYVYHPQLDDKTAFREHCTSGELTIVLGCYVSTQGIYIQNISDKRLNGVLQVTAAHEMLHAAYERLDGGEKARIDALLNQAYAKVTDKRIRETIDDYRKNGADINNELHSILGTEVAELPDKLEEYYQQYFDRREQVVKYAKQYDAAFSQRKAQVAKYDKQLASLKIRIDNLQDSLATQNTRLESEKAKLNSLLKAKNYQAYNAQIPIFNQLVNTYNQDVATTGELISEYNQIVEDRNEVALEENELVKAIDSRPTTIDTQ